MSDRELILKSARLAQSSPEEWSEFLAEFENYTNARRDQCISSPADTVLIAQGRAQQCVSLLRLFDECQKTADQITEKRK